MLHQGWWKPQGWDCMAGYLTPPSYFSTIFAHCVPFPEPGPPMTKMIFGLSSASLSSLPSGGGPVEVRDLRGGTWVSAGVVVLDDWFGRLELVVEGPTSDFLPGCVLFVDSTTCMHQCWSSVLRSCWRNSLDKDYQVMQGDAQQLDLFASWVETPVHFNRL